MPTVLNSANSSAASDSAMESYSLLFPLFDKADVVVRSSDGTLFATMKFYLQAASPVFADVLELGIDGDMRDGRPIVQLQETADELEPFLRLVQQDRFVQDGAELVIDIPLLVKVSPLVEKYQSSHLAWCLYEQCLPTLLVPWKGEPAPRAQDIPSLLALAIIHDKEKAAKAALRSFGHWFTADSGGSVFTHIIGGSDPDQRSTDQRYHGLEDFPLHLLERMPAKAIQHFSMLHRKVSNWTAYSWDKAADDFKL